LDVNDNVLISKDELEGVESGTYIIIRSPVYYFKRAGGLADAEEHISVFKSRTTKLLGLFRRKFESSIVVSSEKIC
jgi:hypothetical protein